MILEQSEYPERLRPKKRSIADSRDLSALEPDSVDYVLSALSGGDVVIEEAGIILDTIEQIARDPSNQFHEAAKKELERDGRIGLVRGAIKIYLGKYTTRDWRRKRFTDDIDFWIFEKPLLEHVLKQSGWKKSGRVWPHNIPKQRLSWRLRNPIRI